MYICSVLKVEQQSGLKVSIGAISYDILSAQTESV